MLEERSECAVGANSPRVSKTAFMHRLYTKPFTEQLTTDVTMKSYLQTLKLFNDETMNCQHTGINAECIITCQLVQHRISTRRYIHISLRSELASLVVFTV